MNKYLYSTGISLVALTISCPAHAQEAGAATIPEIIVTGQKRTENLQDISVAASVISGDDLAAQGVERLDDLQNLVPSLSISDAGLTQAVNIRGIGLASGSPNAANGVATYFDGVFQPPIVSTNSFYDINSVEVFRGPQGTFVGSNSTGGAIFINSRDPKLGTIEGYVQGEVGNHDRFGLEGALNLPLSDTLAIRMAGIHRQRDSFYTMENDLPAPAYLNEEGFRVGLNFEPTTNFRLLVKGEIARKSTGGYAFRPILGTVYEDARTDDIYILNYNSPSANDEKADQISAKLEYETDSGIIFRSVSGYQNKRISNLYDRDATDVATSTQEQFVRERVWTQELNILSPENQAFRWILGGYYQRNRVNVDIANDAYKPVYQHLDIQNRKTTTGIFGQVSYDLSEQLSADLGVRYSTYKVVGWGAVELLDATGAQVRFLADPGGREKDNKVTGKFALNWRPSQDHLLYAFVARGYKSGGFASTTQNFKPETVIDYEIGWKGTLAGGAVTTQVGAFYYDYKDFQLDTVNEVTGRNSLTNLANATVKGAEAQVQVREGGFNISGTLAYTDSSLSGATLIDARELAFVYPGVQNTPACPAGQPTTLPNCIDYAGEGLVRTTAGGRMLFSPKWTYSVSASYTLDMGNLSITPRMNFSHVGSRFTYIAYDPVRDRLPSYDLLGASVLFEFDRFGIELWGSNLTKEKYSTGQTGNVNEFYGAPREYGVRAKVQF